MSDANGHSEGAEPSAATGTPNDEETQRHRVLPLIRFSVERRVTMFMFVVGLLVLGWMSLTRLPLEFLPAFSSSSVSVSVPYPSASPEEVEREIVRPLEDSLGTINGLETLSAVAAANNARVNLTFVDGTNMDLAAVEVRDRIDRVRQRLPDDVERVYVRRFQSSDIPILRSSVASTVISAAELNEVMEDVVQPRLERLEGVAQVSVWGAQSRELRVDLIPERLSSHSVDVRQLTTLLQRNNVNVAAGYLEEGSRRLLVRAVGEFQTVGQLRDLVIRGDGLRLGDVADVRFDYPRREDYNFLNGDEAIHMGIYKASTSNLLEVVNRVKAELDRLREDEPGLGLEFRHFHDTSVDVSQGLRELGRSGLLGGVLAILFMFLFLRRLRTTLLVAVAVPLSLVTTFVILYLSRQSGLTEVTLNVMSLMGLMLAIGMLFDNSIVVIDSIFRHHHELGESARRAALRGASEVAMPIIASTATTMCVFVPLIFLSSGGGGFTRWFGDIGLMVCVVMIASLLVSLTVVPMLGALLLRSERSEHHGALDRVSKIYGTVIRFTLRHRFAFAVAVGLLLFFSWRLYSGIERTFSPPSEGRQITLFVETPKRFSVEERRGLFEEVYGILDAGREQWEIVDIAHSFKRGGGRARGRHGGSANRFELYLSPEEAAELKTSEIQDGIRAALPVHAGVDFKIGRTRAGPPGSGSSGVSMELVGDDLAVLELLTPMIIDRLATLPMLKDIDTSLESDTDEVRVSVNRERALQAGLSSQAVARTVNNALSTRSLSYFKTEDREVGIVMQYREEDRETLDQLSKMPVFTPNAELPISSLASFEVAPGARTIERENRRAKLEIEANASGNMPSFALMRPIQGVLGTIGLPAGYEWSFGRSWRDAESDAGLAVFALLLAVLMIYMVMASLFENFAQPFTIMLSIPFAFIGVGLVMSLAGQARSSTADMGLVILAGIVVNNAIVLIDHINKLRAEGLSREEAIVQGGRNRLRPILLTAVTTILGLSPMVAPFFLPEVFGQPEGRAAYWAPVSLVILGGLTTSTFLTVLVIPTIYSLVDDATRFVRRVVFAT